VTTKRNPSHSISLTLTLATNTGPIYFDAVTINQKPIKIIIDTGAGNSVLNSKFVADGEIESAQPHLTGISGKSIPVAGTVSFSWFVQGYKLEQQFLVQSNCPVDGILGNDYLGERKPNIDYKNQIV
jgi:hypothetical protein